ncbi:hypothetical protein KC315_g5655 [Hortaea werneckii]|nr:hypothetical protein KC315_g5655 [Hortaea werneckii]
MFITLVLAVTDNDHWNQPMLSAIEPTYSDTHGIPVETLVGSVYDEVLLWSLCVFYALAGRLIERQLRCFRRLLHSFTIPPEAKSWLSLQRLMKRIRDFCVKGAGTAFHHDSGGNKDEDDDDYDDVFHIDHVENGQLSNDTFGIFIPVHSRTSGDRRF